MPKLKDKTVIVTGGAGGIGGATCRRFAAEGAKVEMNAVYLAAANRHVDLTSRVTHAAPGVHTRQLVRGVARKGGRAVFQGKFLVERAGQKTDADMARRHTEVFLRMLSGAGFARPNPRPMFPNPPGLLPLEPYSEGLRERIWWGAGSDSTARWAGRRARAVRPGPWRSGRG